MRKLFVFVGALLAMSGVVAALDVPPLTAAELSPEANPFWLFLAGDGLWGTIVIGIFGFAYKLLREYIIAWVKDRKLSALYLAIESCVAKINAIYVEGMKASNADGKLTEDEKRFVLTQCKAEAITFMRGQGVDIVKEYGESAINALIELIVSRMNNPLMKAVAAPLPDLQPLQFPAQQGAMPE